MNCSLCGEPFSGMGNNPEPLAEFEQRCCDVCNETKVIPARIARMVVGPARVLTAADLGIDQDDPGWMSEEEFREMLQIPEEDE